MARFAVVLTLVVLVASFAAAQTDLAAGIQPFSTQIGGPIDSVDVATSNILIRLPVRSKVGALPFSYVLVSNSHAYKGPSGQNGTSQLVSYGFSGQLMGLPSNRLTSSKNAYTCQAPNYLHQDYAIIDSTGASHPLDPDRVAIDEKTCNPPPQGVTTIDGSGFTVNFINYATADVYDKSGNKVSGGLTTPVIYDPDGNTISLSGGVFTDTLGQVAMTRVIQNGSPDKYQYTDANGNTQTFQVNYSPQTLMTNFGCYQEGPPVATTLPSSIAVPGGGQYNIYYEATAGYSGDVTGRIAKITLPAGGYVSYAYSGGSNGLNCAAQVVPTLTRTVYDNNGNTSVWTYMNSNASSAPGNFIVTEMDPAGSKTLYSFAGGFQTQAVFYQGTTTVLKTVTTCYGSNGAAPPVPPNCASPTTVPVLPITETDVYTSLGTSATNRVKTTFDPVYGTTTSVVAYDFGASTPTSQTFTSYGQSWNGTSCAAYPAGKNVFSTPCYSHTENSSSDVAKTQITYSNTGHPTSTSRWISGSNSLTTQATYATNGAQTAFGDVNGAVTQYSNGPGVGACNGLLPAKTTEPLLASGVQLSTTFVWDCNGGVLKSATDVKNGTTTTYKYVNSSNVADPLWRLVSITRPDGGVTTTTYNTGSTHPWNVQTSTTIAGTTNTTSQVNYDGLFRPIATLLTSDPGGTDEVDTKYDLLGRVLSVTVPYRGTPTTYATSYTYDAIGRYKTITNPDGTSRSFTWTNRATEITDENNLLTIQQIDGLGRLKYVCSGINATTQANGQGPTTCTNVDITASGFLATYGYDALGNLLTAAYSGESRTYTYDGVSRLTKSIDPESGTVNYTYDTIRNGDFYQKKLNSLKTITYSWDLLHRLTAKTYSDSTPSVSYNYDETVVQGLALAYPYGRMTSALSQTASGAVVGSAFSYDTMGRVVGQWSCTPLVCPSQSSLSAIALNFGWDNAGDLTSITNASDNSTWAQGVTWSYTYDATPNLTSITTNAITGYSPQTLFTHSTQTPMYGPARNLLSALTGDSVTRNYGYDQAFRPNSINLSGGTIGTGQNWSVGYYGNNSVHTAADPVNGSWSYGYDKFNRLSTASCSGACPYNTSSQALGFTYDQYGNRWTQTATGGLNPSFAFNTKNQITSASGVVYDSDGNLTNDGNGNTFSYDPEGKLTASVVGGVSSTYKNDPLGHRAESVSTAGTFDYVYDPSGRLITETDTTCNSGSTYYPCTDFVYIGASSIPFSQFSDWACCAAYATFNYYDFAGSLRETTSYAGLSAPYQNDPFGDSSSAQPGWFGFAQLLTMGSGLQLSSTRGYHQVEARWLTPDPSGMAAVNPQNPQSWNQYAYVLNNPISAIDPDGLDCVYLNDAGDGVDSIDHDSDPDECSGDNNGGYWIPGTVANSSWVTNIDQNNNQIGAFSQFDNGALGWTGSTNQLGGGWATVGIDVPASGVAGNVYTSADDMSPSAQRTIAAIAKAAPTVCGGGAFGYYGKGATALGAKAFTGGIVEADSESGISGGSLNEIGVGGVGGGSIVSSGGASGLAYTELAEIPFFGNVGLVAFPTGVGVYAEGEAGNREFGGGLYVNVVPNAGCHK